MDLATARRQTRKRRRGTRTSDADAFSLGGGLNLVDPPMTIKPGYALAGENYEIGVAGGYESLGGFERFDGQAAPSAQLYYILSLRHLASFPPIVQPAQLVTGAGTGSATILHAFELTSPGQQLGFHTETVEYWTDVSVDVVEVADPVLPTPPDYAVPFKGQASSPNGFDTKSFVPRRIWSVAATAVTGTHYVQPVAITGAVAEDDRILASVFARAPGAVGYVQLEAASGGFATPPSAIFDLVAGEVVSSTSTVADAYMDDYGNGWWRCVVLTDPATIAVGSGICHGTVRLVDEDLAVNFVGADEEIEVSGWHYDLGAGADPALTPYIFNRLQASPVPSGAAYLVLRALTVSFEFVSASGQQNVLAADATVLGTQSGSETPLAAPTLEAHLTYLSEVADAQRELILKVPGAGRIRGVAFYAGLTLAWRDNAAGTLCKMFKSTSSGWTEVTFVSHLNFDAGLAAGEAGLIEGATVNGATSGATGVVKRVNIVTSTWGASTATGTLALTGITGVFQDNEKIRVGVTNMADAQGVIYTPTWDDGGRYYHRINNFFGAANKRRLYGVNGLNKAFDYDAADNTLTAIRTGMTIDTPTRICHHQQQLGLMFPGGSFQRSGISAPANWTVVVGANEIMLGDDATDFLEEVGDSLFMFTRDRTLQLTGNAADGYALDKFDRENGAIANSVQRIGFGIHLDDRGFASLSSSDKFGNYESNTFSGLIQPLVDTLLKNATVTESVIHRGANRYRCFFDDGTFISIGVRGAKVTGHMRCSYGMVVRCAVSDEDTTGVARMFFGSDDGYIYEAGKGTSFDGKPIDAGIRFPHHHSGRPGKNKKYRRGRIEANLQGQTTLYATIDLSFGKLHLKEKNISAAVGGAIWDHTMTWEGFYWDKVIEPLKTFKIGASGTNISIALRHRSAVEKPHTLRAVNYQTTVRALDRRTSA